MGAVIRKYGVATTILFPLIDFDQNDFEATPVSHASGDTQISKDEGAFANTTNAFAHEGGGIYSLALSSTEMEAARIVVFIKDQSNPKLWEDQAVLVETYGNANAQHEFDLDSPTVTLADDGITAAKIAANAIGSSEIADGAITAAKIATDAIDADALADNAITAGTFAAGAIDASAIAANAIGDAELAADLDTYQAKVWMSDDDGGTTDRYVVVWFKNGQPYVTGGGITSPTIQVYKAADATDLIASTALTEIGTTETYRYDATGAERITDGAMYIALVTATIDGSSRTWYQPIQRDS